MKDPSRFGVVVIDQGKIVKLVEKPKEYVSDYSLAGVYLFKPSIFLSIKRLKHFAWTMTAVILFFYYRSFPNYLI